MQQIIVLISTSAKSPKEREREVREEVRDIGKNESEQRAEKK